VAERTWEARELQLLEAIAESEREHDENVGNAALAERTGLPDEEVEWGLKALHEADPPFITGIEAGGLSELLGIRLRERGRRVVGQWPTENAAEALIALIREREEDESDPVEKTRLARFAEAVGNVGRETATQLVIAAAKQAAGF
jgi:hypothetical protein